MLVLKAVQRVLIPPYRSSALLSKYKYAYHTLTLLPKRTMSSTSADRTTSRGVTWDLISKSGREHPESKVGLYVGDGESYDVFWDKLKPVVEKCHHVSIPDEVTSGLQLPESISPLQPKHDLTCPESTLVADLSDPSSPGNIATDCRVRVARNLKEFPFPSFMTDEDRSNVRKQVQSVVESLDMFQKGYFVELGKESEAHEQVQAHLTKKSVPMFHNNDKYLTAANVYEGWPNDRVILMSDDFNTCVWINEEDHIRIMSVQPGLQLDKAIACVANVASKLEQELGFAHSPYLGYLTSCPSNLGTGMRCSSQIHFGGNMSQEQVNQILESVKEKFDMQVRSSKGEAFHDFSDGIYNLSYQRRLGITERDILQKLISSLEYIYPLTCQK